MAFAAFHPQLCDASFKRPVGRPRSNKSRTICALPGSEVPLMPSYGKVPLTSSTPPANSPVRNDVSPQTQTVFIPMLPVTLPVFSPNLMLNQFGSFVSSDKTTKKLLSSKNTTKAGALSKCAGISKKSTTFKIKGDSIKSKPPHKLCSVYACNKIACYGIPGSKPMFCKFHSAVSPGMVKVITNLCEQEGCGKHRIFAFAGERPRFCKGHSLPGMVDVKSKKCDVEGCSRSPTCSIPGRKPHVCRLHASPGMIYNIPKDDGNVLTPLRESSSLAPSIIPLYEQISAVLSGKSYSSVEPNLSPKRDQCKIREVDGASQDCTVKVDLFSQDQCIASAPSSPQKDSRLQLLLEAMMSDPNFV